MFRTREAAGRLLRRVLPEARVRQARDRWERVAGPRYLHMAREGLEALPPVSLPWAFRLEDAAAGRDRDYLRVVRRSLAEKADDRWFRQIFYGDPAYDPANLFVAYCGDAPAGAAAAWQRTWRGEPVGLVHMVGVDPAYRGQGLGRALVLAVLHRERERGFRQVLLLTEDFRIPALSLYLSLGFRPLRLHWTHRLRWRKVLRRVNRIDRKH